MATKDIPGPLGWWFVGNALELDAEHYHNTIWKWKEEFGPIYEFKVFSKNTIVISDIDLMKQAFNVEDLCHRPNNFANVLMYDGSGVVSANFSEQQRVLKDIVWRVLIETNRDKELLKLSDMEVLDFIDSITTGEDINLKENVARSTASQLASEFIGIPTSRTNHSSTVMQFIDATNELYRHGRELILTMFPWLRYIPGTYRHVVNDLYEKQTRLVELFMHEARETYIKDDEHSILHRLITKRKAENDRRGTNYITEENLYSCILELLMASVLPMSQHIEFAILCAIKHPDMQEMIYNEIARSGPIHDLTLDELPYFQAFVFESFRYLSLVIITVPRFVNKDTVVDGYLFKKDSMLLGSLFNLHHDEEIWDDPWVFRPERFLDENRRLLPVTEQPMKSLKIFGFKFRDCKAQETSLKLVHKYLLHVFYIFKVKPPIHSELPSFDPREYNTITVLNVPAFECRFERRI